MPWCDDCSKFWNLPELAGGSRCPSCDQVLATATGSVVASGAGAPSAGAPSAATVIASGAGPEGGAGATTKRAPWHFKLLVVGVAGYMVYRVIWFIEWLPKHV